MSIEKSGRWYPHLDEKGSWDVQFGEMDTFELDRHVFWIFCDIANALKTLVSLNLVEKARPKNGRRKKN